MKRKAKKASSYDKIERVKTGGGWFATQVDTVDEKLLAILGNRATPLFNSFDNDAEYNGESCMITERSYIHCVP
jgi:hypothetical protein